MNKTIYGVRSVARHFKVSRDVIRRRMENAYIFPKKEKVGERMVWAFSPNDLKEIARTLKKKKAAS